MIRIEYRVTWCNGETVGSWWTDTIGKATSYARDIGGRVEQRTVSEWLDITDLITPEPEDAR